MKRLLPIAFSVISSIAAQAQTPLYKDPKQPVDARVEDLLKRMTPEEKFWQLFMIPGEVKLGEEEKYRHGIFGFQVSAAGQSSGASGQMLQYNATERAQAVAEKINRMQEYFLKESRLGIPIIPFDEALHGLVRAGATAFPQSIALAATFDTTLMGEVAQAIARETRARGIRQILSPVINLATDVRWGRTEETYGEDPYLSSMMGVAYMGALERMGIVATPKHFLANVGDGGRDSYPISSSEWYLRQTHLAPFRAAFKLAGARSVMTSYNSLDGIPATANPRWLLDWLKKEQDFKGFVISDASATGGANVLHMTTKDYPASAANAINGGLDVIFQTDYDHYKLFIPPFLDGRINKARLDDAVRGVLRAKFELGLFEHPYVNIPDVERLVDVKHHKALARKSAASSFTLLQNKGMLPLKGNLGSLAVIGQDADMARLGGYSGPGNEKISILDGLKEALKTSVTRVRYAAGYDRSARAWKTVPASVLTHKSEGRVLPGLKGTYHANTDLSGSPVFERIDKQLDFHWTLFPPDDRLSRDFYSVRWTGMLTPDSTGRYRIGLDGNEGFRLWLDDKLIVDAWEKRSYSTRLSSYNFIKGKSVNLRVEFREPVGNAHVRLIWDRGIIDPTEKLRREAVALAASSDAVVVVAGIHEGEFQDRAMLSLDHGQEELIRAVAAAGKPVTLLLVGGSAITMSGWRDRVNAIGVVWYPGEEGGRAVADVLTGKISPAGRLPITYPVHEAQLPLSYWHLPTGRGDDYHNLSGEPLFPFGFGLSYTQFNYHDFRLSDTVMKAGDTAWLSFKITNSGSYDGDEVPQLYIRDEIASVARPVMELKSFSRMTIKKGETANVRMAISPDMLTMWNAQNKEVIEPGDFRIMVGASSKDLRWKGTLRVE
jgi:beta-glucosidase